MSYKVTLVRGDGTGPELTEVTAKVLDSTGVKIDWEVMEAGIDIMETEGTPLPDKTLQSIAKNKIALKGPITTPIGTGFRSVNVGVKSKFSDIDLVVVRENTEDLYAGVEFFEKTDEANKIIELSKGKIRKDSAISIKSFSEFGCQRIVKFAFDYAIKNNRKKVTAVAKANIMKTTDGMFYRVAREVSKDYEGKIEYEERLIDNMCMQLVQKPELYDVIVLPNLYGDILSDLCAGLVGGLGVAPGANLGKDCAVFEAVHGSAPKYKGLNKVNPMALILSGKMMLDYLGEFDAAKRLEKAVADSGAKDVTFRLFPSRYYSIEGGYDSMKKLLSATKDDRPTAVIASDDYSAIGVIDAIREEGLSVPEDISVVGFDGIEITQRTSLKLTTIRQDTKAIGEEAAKNLLAQISGEKDIDKTRKLPPQLILGESCRDLNN